MSGILVIRPQPQADALAEKLLRRGLTVWTSALLRYEDVDFELPELSLYQAFVFTSAEGVRAFARKHTGNRDKIVFCVGDTTARAATMAGFSDVQSATGDGVRLAQVLRDQKEDLNLRRVLHVSGADIARDMAKLLMRDGITVDRVIAYKAELEPHFSADAERALKTGQVDTILFFSARVAEHAVSLMLEKDMRGISGRIYAICMSPRVAAALGGIPWKEMRVAPTPDEDAMLSYLFADDIRDNPESLQAESVIMAFGGLRPLAQALDIAPSTVQGWRARGVVPTARNDAIIEAAKKMGLDVNDLYKEKDDSEIESEKIADAEEKISTNKAGSDRRSGADRRRKAVKPDAKGQIKTDTYSGPDRRTAHDRRAAHKRKQRHIARTLKIAFLNKMVVSFAILGAVMIVAGYFLLAPEFVEMERNAARVAEMEARMQELTKKYNILRSEQKKQVSIGGQLNRQVESLQQQYRSVRDTAQDALSTAGTAATALTGVTLNKVEETIVHSGMGRYIELLTGIQVLDRSSQGRAAKRTALSTLMDAVKMVGGAPEHLNDAVELARKKDPTLQILMSDLSHKQLGAAALLLGLNELRGKLGAHKPFKEDLELVKNFAGHDPEMIKALEALAPYAESGVLNRIALQKEFKNMAGDVIRAKMARKNGSVQDKALRHLSDYLTIRKVDGKGDPVDNTVASAQDRLNSGDVRGALTVLQTLDGAPAQAALPWMKQAAGLLNATAASELISHSMMQSLVNSGGAPEGFSLNTVIESVKDSFSGAGSDDVLYISPSMLPEKHQGLAPPSAVVR